jgi:hypothetical protein
MREIFIGELIRENVETVAFFGEKFEKFLHLLFLKSDSFSLTEVPWTEGTNNELEKALEPYIINQFCTPIWYGYYAGDMSLDELPVKKIYMYQANEATQKILLDYIDDIFLRKLQNNKLTDSDMSLEDLNFFIKDTWLLGTVSHEMMATLYNKDDTFDELLNEIGNWKKIEEPSFLKISDFVS